MLALIDADICCYRTAFSCQKTLPDGNIELEPESIAIARFNEMIEQILSDTGATEYQLWLSDKTENNFRLQFYPEYKANRKKYIPPVYLDLLKEYAIKQWGAQITCNQEADDQLGIEQCRHLGYSDIGFDGGDSVIASIDKDLKQISGNHFNFVTKEKSFVTPEDGLRFFYTQLLVGDVSDNIQGCPKCGIVGAHRTLGSSCNDLELFNRVFQKYKQAYEKLGIKHEEFIMQQILQNGRCLKIRTYEGEIWNFPENVVNANNSKALTNSTGIQETVLDENVKPVSMEVIKEAMLPTRIKTMVTG